MIRASPDDVARPPATVVAQFLLQCTRDDPTLIKRSRARIKAMQAHAIQPPVMRSESRSPSILPANTDPAFKQYFEDLVSISVASSERADDLLREAYDANRKASYATWAFSSVAAISVAVGLTAGAIGMIGSRHGNTAESRLTEIAGEVKSLGQRQQQASRQLAAVRSEIATSHTPTATVQQAADAPPADTQDAAPVETLQASAEPLDPSQQPASPQPAVVSSDVADNHTDTTTARQPADTPQAETQPAIPMQTLPTAAAHRLPTQPFGTKPYGVAPENPVQEATYSAPWPAYHHHHRHQRRPVRIVQRRRGPVMPRFLVVFQQNLQALFR